MFWRYTFLARFRSTDQTRITELERLVSQLALQLAAQKPSKTTPSSMTPRLSSKAFKAYLVEYEQCMQSYRHTYATIWQAGAIFSAISAAIIAFTTSSVLGTSSQSIPPLIQILAPIPVLFWYHGIYRPMNRYGELRNDRIAELEELLNENIPSLHMSHFRRFSRSRKGERRIKRILKLKWLWKPRVSEIITIFGFFITILEIYLLWINYLSHFHL